jgi:hypothetical protein
VPAAQQNVSDAAAQALQGIFERHGGGIDEADPHRRVRCGISKSERAGMTPASGSAVMVFER